MDGRVHVNHHPLIRSTLQKKEDHHGDAFRRILWYGYVIFSHILTATSSRWTVRGHCWRILLNYLNWLRKKLICTLIHCILFLASSQLDCPETDPIELPLTSPSGCAFFLNPQLSLPCVFSWLLCVVFIVWWPFTATECIFSYHFLSLESPSKTMDNCPSQAFLHGRFLYRIPAPLLLLLLVGCCVVLANGGC